MISTQFAFEYEVVKVNKTTGTETVSVVWTPLWNKKSLYKDDVKEVRLKQTQNGNMEENPGS